MNAEAQSAQFTLAEPEEDFMLVERLADIVLKAEKPLSPFQIWQAFEDPKPSITAVIEELREWHDEDPLAMRLKFIGGIAHYVFLLRTGTP